MTSLRPYKFVVQAIPQRLGDDGSVIGEVEAQPIVLFGCDALARWAAEFPEKLDAAVTEAQTT